MKIGIVGLGRMGSGMAQRLIRKGHECVVYDAKPAAVTSLQEAGATGAASMQEMVAQMARPRAIWLMIPAAMVDHALNDLVPLLAPDDIIIDGGNSYYRDDMRRAAELKARGIHYLDVGTSGGVAGIDRGYCLMIGGEAETVAHLRPIFSSLAPGMAVAARTPGRNGNPVGHVSDSGEGRWTVQAAIEEGVPSNVLSAALFARFASRGQAGFSDRVLSAMRAGFGGHMEKTDE
jgi:6-phosphogluconate dehydrogenase